MSRQGTGLHRSVKVYSCTLVLLLSSNLVICDDATLASLIESVFGPPPNENNGNIDPNKDNTLTNNEPVVDVNNGFRDITDPEVKPNQNCVCVPYYQCDNNTKNIITDGTGLIDIRIRTESCESYMDECCYHPSVREEPITPKPKGRTGCGKRNVDGVGFRITGNVDNEAQFGEFPWMIAIVMEDILADGTVLNMYQCGGSLIHEKVVLTAAHCVIGKNPSTLKARAGEWDTQTTNELYPHQDRKVVKIITHDKYYSGALYNDIALIVLESPFTFADNVDIVCLPLQGSETLNNECYASGWGKNEFAKEGKYQSILKKIDLPMVPRDKCVAELRKTRLGPYFRLHSSFVCAGGIPGKDTCKGDGGSPLVCPIPGRSYQYQQVGIVAWGIGCGNETPAVYVNVAMFRDWIDEQIKNLNLKFEYTY